MKETNKGASQSAHDNRINVIMAIIFLLGGGLIWKLYGLQVGNYDLYMEKADGQHKSFTVLEPERGRIFIQDDRNSSKNNSNGLYPLATNKEFSLIYAVPKDVKDPVKIAEALFTFFKKEQIEKEVDDMLKKEDEEQVKKEEEALKNLPEEERKIKEAELKANQGRPKFDQHYLEFRETRREMEITARKKSTIEEYLNILTKQDDPYEPIEKKVEDVLLKKLYVALADREIKETDLKINNNKVLYLDTEGKETELKIEGIGQTSVNYRFYPENNVGSNMLGFVGLSGDDQEGHYGLEGFFNEELSGKAGSVKSERGAGGSLVIVNDREYIKPENGSDLVLTIDRAIQFTVCQKLNAAVLRHGADSGSVVIIEPSTGAILAMCSSPDYNPNNYKNVSDLNIYNNEAVFSQYEPGSIFKALTMAMALDQGKVTPDTTYDDTGVVNIANYSIKNSDHLANGVVNMNVVLEKSLNTGAIFAMRQIGSKLFSQYVKDFGFGEKTGIELEGEAKGDIRNLLSEKANLELNAATASFGQGIAVTPIQMVAAFGALANGGILMKPYLVKEIARIDGSKITTEPRQIKRVVSERAAALLGGMLVNVVENGHGAQAGVKGYYVGGKTGTAQVPRKDGRGYQAGVNIGSFAGFAPVSNPRFAMLVRINHPRDVVWAESSAAPLFGEIAEFLLNYWQVPTEREITDKK